MALQIWLPLDGNFTNKGLAGNLNFATTGTITNVDGKIGKCKKFSSASAIAPYSFTLGDEASVALWVNYTSLPASNSNDWLIHLASTSNYGNAVFGLSTYHETTFTVMVGGNYDSTYVHGFSTNTWYHIAFVWKNPKAYLYVNGNLVKTYTNLSGGTKKTSNKISLAANVVNSTTRFKGSLNDVRLYNHALSPKEVKEISNALVLHYTLNNISNKNLILSRKSYSPASYQAYQFNLSENLVANETYTFQLWDVDVAHSGKTADQLGISIYWGGGNIALKHMNGTSWFTNGHANYITFTYTITQANASGNGAGNKWLNIYNSVPSKTGTLNMSIGAIKVEKGATPTPWSEYNTQQTIIYDCSGYERNGTIVGNSLIVNDTQRYSTCLQNTTEYPLNVVFDFPESSGLTIACLMNLDAWGTQYSGLWSTSTSSTTTPSDYTTTTCNHYDQKFALKGTNGTLYTVSCGSSAVPLNTWTHVVLTHDGVDAKLYINGTLSTTKAIPTSLVGFKSLFLGWSKAGGVERKCQGKWSDFRIYATALSEDDIIDLYNVSEYIYNNDTIAVYEMIEKTDNLTLTKTGLIQCNSYEERSEPVSFSYLVSARNFNEI